jgi:hypothetical protein
MTSQRTWIKLILVVAMIAAIPVASFPQHGKGNGDLTHQHPAVPDASVDFGVLPLDPIGPPPCIQSGAGIGGPTDPCA